MVTASRPRWRGPARGQDRNRREGRQARLQARLQGKLQCRRIHQRVPDELAALCRVHDGGRTARQQKHVGYSTAGWVAAPAAGRVIARIAPMLGLLPDIQDAPTINQALLFRCSPPARPVSARPGGGRPPHPHAGVPRAPASGPTKPSLTIPATTLPPAQPIRRDPRHEAGLPTAHVTDASVATSGRAVEALAAR